jgi:Ca2+-binding EF-hand superfamily protein
MIINERDLESSKMYLAEQVDFNLVDAFQMMDDMNRGFVTKEQIMTILVENRVFVEKEEILKFVQRFDRTNEIKLLYSDFCEAFTPKDSYYNHILVNRKPTFIYSTMAKRDYFAE